MEIIKIVLADDHAVLRSGLRLLINSQPDMNVTGEAGSGEEAVKELTASRPDVLLLDLALPGMDGVSVIKLIRQKEIPVKILVLTMYEDVDYLKKVIQAGANGYLVKKAGDNELLSAIRMVFKGSLFIDPALAGELASHIWNSPGEDGHRGKPVLSERELEILKYIALGYTNKQIASELVVSIKTVESHKANIKTKLKLNNRSELVRYAIERKVI